MRDPVHTAIVAAMTAFVTASTAASIGAAALYARAAGRVAALPTLAERDLRVMARPIRLTVGEQIPKAAVEMHLRRLGYYAIDARERGCYHTDATSLTIWARFPELSDVTIRWQDDEIVAIEQPSGEPAPDARIESETVAVTNGDVGAVANRFVERPVPLAALEDTPLVHAIIASEDRTFATHHGLDLRRLALAPLLGGGASTITMQLARVDVLQDRSRTVARKLNEIGVAMAIERLRSKDDILRAYVNTVDVGASHGQTVRGFGAAAREFVDVDDVRRITPAQAATLVALLNQPTRYLDGLRGGDDTRLRLQRNRVLRLMQQTFPDHYGDLPIHTLQAEPAALAVDAAPVDNVFHVSRYFLDAATAAAPPLAHGRLYLTLDARLQRIAADAVDRGVRALEGHMVSDARPQLQASLLAIDPRDGDVLAMIGGRSYDASQYNRATTAARQIGSVMKPFDYLAAFERATDEGRHDRSPSTLVVDEPTEFRFPGLRPWRPSNYGREYSGTTTWTRALAHSRNVAAVKVASEAGIGRVARLWQAASGQHLDGIFPSLALGAVSATAAEVARAYSIFATGGVVMPLQTVLDAFSDDQTVDVTRNAPSRVAREETTRLVAGMMRAVLDEGTGHAARTAGFTADAAGKTGTTNDLRDAWFAGFTSDLLVVVWVGRDDNRPLGLTGAQAALPIWTDFMLQAGAGADPASRPSTGTSFDSTSRCPSRAPARPTRSPNGC